MADGYVRSFLCIRHFHISNIHVAWCKRVPLASKPILINPLDYLATYAPEQLPVE